MEKAKHFVNVYTVEQCYGGPEEGGWWYSYYNFQGCHGLYEQSRAEKVRKIVEQAYKNYKPTYHMGNGPWDGADAEGHGDDHYLSIGGARGEDKIDIWCQEEYGKEYSKRQRRPTYC